MGELTAIIDLAGAGGLQWTLWVGLALLSSTAGFIKGITGFGYPMIMFSGLSLFFEPATAVACLTFPLLVVNIIQALQFGIRASIHEFRSSALLTIALCISIFLTAPLIHLLQPAQIFAIIGPTITFVAGLQVAGWKFRLAPSLHRFGAAVAGIGSGICGGFAGVWAPLVVIYLLALNIEKNRQILIQGVVYTIGSLALIAAHSRTGIFNSTTLPLSMTLIVPSLLGLWIGSKVLGKMNRKRFVVCTLILLIAAGINLIWRATTS